MAADTFKALVVEQKADGGFTRQISSRSIDELPEDELRGRTRGELYRCLKDIRYRSKGHPRNFPCEVKSF